jgi:nucleotide-binding universal stress UspA family protein
MFRTILVDVGFDPISKSRVALAHELAVRFNASLIGFAAAAVQPPIVSEVGVVVPVPAPNNTFQGIQERLRECEGEFRALAGSAAWTSGIEEPTQGLITEAAGADLLIVSGEHGAGIVDPYRGVDVGDLALRGGRAILAVPPSASRIAADRILVAWKDTREARRAVRDALPFLREARDVEVLSVLEREGPEATAAVDRVMSFLARHGVSARSHVVRPTPGRVGDQVLEVARAGGFEFIVAGAYGHSRLREWIFGGVTRSLLNSSGVARFLSN